MISNDWMRKNISSSLIFAVGLLLIPAFILQSQILIRSLQLAFFMMLSLFSGKRLRLVRSIIFVVFVTLFNLLNPAGRVMFTIGSFAVTEQALKGGLFKAMTFLGLFYVSSFSVRRDIPLRGTPGFLVSRTFGYFNLLLQERTLRPKRLVESLDQLLLRTYSCSPEAIPDASREPGSQTSAGGYAAVAFLVALNWCLTILSLTDVISFGAS